MKSSTLSEIRRIHDQFMAPFNVGPRSNEQLARDVDQLRKGLVDLINALLSEPADKEKPI